MTHKENAASRTVDMFAQAKSMDERPVEVVEEEKGGERVPLEQDVDANREQAFRVQEWTTAAFGRPDAAGNEFRVSFKGEHYYLEKLGKHPGGKSASSYMGLMVHELDLLNLTKVLVAAVREKQSREVPDDGKK